jgi:GntR family transcriptional regulator
MDVKVPIPKYFTIKAILCSRLERESVPGDRVPSEQALCAEFKVSRVTIQQALRLLEKEGVVARDQGRGTFYRGLPAKRMETAPSQLLESLIREQAHGFTRLLATRIVPATVRIAERLKLPAGALVVHIERVGVADGEPIVYIRASLPYDVGAPLLADEQILTRQTLGSLLHDGYGIEVDSVVQTIAATLADPALAEHLGVDVGAAVLEGERTYFDRAGRAIIFSDAFYRADRHRFSVTLKDWR